jgi:uncharacterized membrane protein YebE (DUF533 family)
MYMSLQHFLNQLVVPTDSHTATQNTLQGFGDMFNRVTSQIPGGLAGGAAAGGIMALLMSSKSARKIAGSAATIGGAALLGGLAYKAYKNWQYTNASEDVNVDRAFSLRGLQQTEFQLTLIKAMIAAAKVDGHIDEVEQQRIFKAVDHMELSPETKGLVLDLLRRPITIDEVVKGVTGLEQKSEIFIASCMVLDPDLPVEQIHLSQLASAMRLPYGLAEQLRLQAQQAARELNNRWNNSTV